MLDERTRRALGNDRTIDITTTGRRSGRARRIEIWFYRYDTQGSGLSLTPDRHIRVFLSGSPGSRGWYANLLAHPQFTFHLKGSVRADLPAVARPITDQEERREVIHGIREELGRGYGQEDEWVKRSPLAEVEFR